MGLQISTQKAVYYYITFTKGNSSKISTSAQDVLTCKLMTTFTVPSVTDISHGINPKSSKKKIVDYPHNIQDAKWKYFAKSVLTVLADSQLGYDSSPLTT